MADHGQVEYATAKGNDVAEHKATYENFLQLAYGGSCLIINIVIGLAIGATTGRWGIAIPIIFLVGPIIAIPGLANRAKMPSAGMVGIPPLAMRLRAYT